MANQWFRMYAEFATDPKVQMLSEPMQRRLTMILCLRCSNNLVTLQDEEIAFQLRISETELETTKALFVAKGFIDDAWNVLNWEKRQFASDSSAARVAKHRALQKEKQEQGCNVTETKSNALEQNRTEQIKEDKSSLSPAKLPTCPTDSVIACYHEKLPTLPTVRLKSDTRTKAIGQFWKWVLTSKRTDGQPRATTANEALEWISAYFDRANENDFLMGRNAQTGKHANWTADFDFLLTEKGKRHVIEKTQEAA